MDLTATLTADVNAQGLAPGDDVGTETELAARYGLGDPIRDLDRRREQPWYDSKTEPSFEDMIVKLRKALIVARFSAVSPGQRNPELLRDCALACAAAAA